MVVELIPVLSLASLIPLGEGVDLELVVHQVLLLVQLQSVVLVLVDLVVHRIHHRRHLLQHQHHHHHHRQWGL